MAKKVKGLKRAERSANYWQGRVSALAAARGAVRDGTDAAAAIQGLLDAERERAAAAWARWDKLAAAAGII